jgi:hypothetical protein
VSDDVEYVDQKVDFLPLQIEMVYYDKKWGGSRGGNGSGKTTSWVWWLWLERMEAFPDANHVAIGATYRQLREGLFDTYRDVLVDQGLKENVDFTYRRNVPWLQLTNGAKLHAWSAEAALRVKGANVQTMILEEPQTWGPRGEEMWTSISTRLRHNVRTGQIPGLEPQGRLSFNPTGVAPGHWLYELVERQWAVPGWKCWQLSTRDNWLLLKVDPGYVKNLEASMSEDRHPVEIDGEYATSGGGAYRSFNWAVNAGAPPPGLPPMGLAQKELLWMLDFNVGYQCSAIAQAHVQQPVVEYKDGRLQSQFPMAEWQRRYFYFIDEIAIPDAGTEDVLAEFLKRYLEHARRWGVIIYGDASGGARSQLMSSQSAIRTNWESIVNGLRRHGIRVMFRVPTANPSVGDRLSEMNQQFRTSGEGFGLIVDPLKCPELVADWRSVKTKAGTNDEIVKSTSTPELAKRTHMSDAAGYMVYVERRIEKLGPASIEFQMVR